MTNPPIRHAEAGDSILDFITEGYDSSDPLTWVKRIRQAMHMASQTLPGSPAHEEIQRDILHMREFLYHAAKSQELANRVTSEQEQGDVQNIGTVGTAAQSAIDYGPAGAASGLIDVGSQIGAGATAPIRRLFGDTSTPQPPNLLHRGEAALAGMPVSEFEQTLEASNEANPLASTVGIGSGFLLPVGGAMIGGKIERGREMAGLATRQAGEDLTSAQLRNRLMRIRAEQMEAAPQRAPGMAEEQMRLTRARAGQLETAPPRAPGMAEEQLTTQQLRNELLRRMLAGEEEEGLAEGRAPLPPRQPTGMSQTPRVNKSPVAGTNAGAAKEAAALPDEALGQTPPLDQSAAGPRVQEAQIARLSGRAPTSQFETDLGEGRPLPPVSPSRFIGSQEPPAGIADYLQGITGQAGGAGSDVLAAIEEAMQKLGVNLARRGPK